MLTCHVQDPSGYGRIIRSTEGKAIAIREAKDCSPSEQEIQEVNPGVYAVDAGFLRQSIQALTTDNAQGELYLTDIVEMF